MRKTSMAKWFALLALLLFCVLFLFPSNLFAASESLCASVKIEIKQEVTLERQAFDAHMRINNRLTHAALENVDIDVLFFDEDGDSVLASSDPDNTEALFFIQIDSVENVDAIDGSGTVAPDTSADIHWLIIPATDASNGLEAGSLYYVGAVLTYTLGGEEYTTEVSPDYIFVKPMPELTLDYFLPVDVYGDDAFTSEIEPPVPFSLGLRVKNNGAGSARNFKIDSAQPKIIDNEQGLLIGFSIEGCEINGMEVSPGLLADFGNILPNESGSARWIMTCSLSGQFVKFTADFSHSDQLGGTLTSLMDDVNTHFLVRDVLVDLPGRDAIRDFLARDGGAYKVFESESVDTDVLDQSLFADLQFAENNGSESIYTLTAPVTAGFMVVQLPDPFAGQMMLKEVVRSDGKRIKPANAWLSKTREGSDPWQYLVNLFDVNTGGSYTLVFDDLSVRPQAPVLQYIPDRARAEGLQLSFLVEASDPNGTIPSLSAAPLPAGASFIDQGNGVGIFDWTPAMGQAGEYRIRFIASDGVLKDSQVVKLTIGGTPDSDGDGMADAWELQYFKTLDRDGNEDFDGDGFTDKQEYDACSHPDNDLSYPLETIVDLKTGFNLVAIPPGPDCRPDLRDWLPDFGFAEEIEKIMVYDEGGAAYVTLVPDDDSNPTHIRQGGHGLIVYALKDKTVSFASVDCSGMDLNPGFNLVGFACAPEGYSAIDLLDALGSETVSSIQRFNSDAGVFETLSFEDEGSIAGIDFPIVPGEGYFIYMKEAVINFTL